IAAQPAALVRLTRAPGFRRRFAKLNEEAKLRRVPRGFPPDHPASEWLKLESFTARASIERSVATSPRLVDHLCRDFELLVPLVRGSIGHLATSRRKRDGEGPVPRGRGGPRRVHTVGTRKRVRASSP